MSENLVIVEYTGKVFGAPRFTMSTDTLFTGPHTVELPQWISPAPFEVCLRMNIMRAEAGESTLTMPFAYELSQGVGLMHGGALVSLADTACCLAIKSVLPENVHFATIEMSSKFLYPVTKGIVRAEARVVHREDRILDTEAEIYNDENRKVLHFAARFKVARKSIL